MDATIAVCRKCKKHECVVDFLFQHTDANVKLVKCQKICEGSVVGVEVGGRMEWFEKVHKAKPLVGLHQLLAPKKGRAITDVAHLPEALRKRRVKDHAGRSPR